ncbi:MAG TPA: glycosyltransferase family 4 protein, partial [Verrucomicrobiae bacterium]|nr:glycosyltransferase family 4 protein [Verrucomicrobiae bacterium]
GVERMLQTLAECKSECPEMESHFAYCFEGRLSGELRKRGEPLYHLGEARARWLPSIWRVRKALRRLLASQQFDCAITHSPWGQAIFGQAIHKAGIPNALWLHDLPNGKHWVERWARRHQPDLVLCNSEFIQGELPKLYSGTPSKVLYYPIPAPKLQYGEVECNALRRELGASRESVVIIQVSRMEPWKGHPMLLDALAKMAAVPGWICWIAGGPQRPWEEQYLNSLRALAAEHGIANRVLFLGQRSDVERLLQAADIFAQPNAQPEPFGIVFVEALYAALPVVTTDFGGGKEVVNTSCGVLVPPKDAGALGEALIRLVNSSELRATLGGAGPARARELTDPKTRLNKLCNQLSNIAANHGSGPLRTANGVNG